MDTRRSTALAENRGFEPRRGFPQHAFQVWPALFRTIRERVPSVGERDPANCGRARTQANETETETGWVGVQRHRRCAWVPVPATATGRRPPSPTGCGDLAAVSRRTPRSRSRAACGVCAGQWGHPAGMCVCCGGVCTAFIDRSIDRAGRARASTRIGRRTKFPVSALDRKFRV